jgi:hypothetical protein
LGGRELEQSLSRLVYEAYGAVEIDNKNAVLEAGKDILPRNLNLAGRRVRQ